MYNKGVGEVGKPVAIISWIACRQTTTQISCLSGRETIFIDPRTGRVAQDDRQNKAKKRTGVFLVPYFLVLILCGVPLLYMELAVGQFTRRGPIGALSQLCPIFKGAGLSSVMVSFFMATYYNVIIAYFLYYLFTSFRASAPWSDCSNKWNTPRCWQSSLNTSRPNFSVSPSEEFYE
ncbi:hypothetical protein J6590_083094 [Homalodisca vitripennis]|nr:hypothetical protein J6590_083094 [Homalodisca vitripennis]